MMESTKTFQNMFASSIPLADTPKMEQTTSLVLKKPNVPANIEEIGRIHMEKVNRISDKLLEKVKISDTGSLGKGITDILSLTATIDMSKIDEDEPGFVGKLTSMFKQTKVKLLARYEDVNQQVERIADNLKTNLTEMKVEDKWLEDLYQENLNEIHAMKVEAERVHQLLAQQTKYVEELKATNDQSLEHAQLVADEVNIQNRLERQIDRMEKMIQIGIMDAPDIRSMQKHNIDTALSFNDLIDVTLPLWKRQLSMALQAAKQLKRAELGNAIADRNNELMRKRADLMHETSIKTAQLSQRSSVADMDTLDHVQAKLIDRLNQVKQIEKAGREQRAQDAKKIAANREALRLEMKSWGDSK